jgi:hypothetical protein
MLLTDSNGIVEMLRDRSQMIYYLSHEKNHVKTAMYPRKYARFASVNNKFLIF